MNRKSFWIPVGWSVEHKVGSLCLNSNTLVLDAPYITEAFEVERIRGSWSPHVPEKRPRYHIRSNRWVQERSPVRLSSVVPLGFILVPLTTARPQTCLERDGRLHGIYLNVEGRNPWTYCGETWYGTVPYKFGIPTCKACLQHKAVWCLYKILPYKPKQELEKRARKEQSSEERHLRLPTAYTRILDDDLFENPTYKPTKYRPPTPDEADPTTDFEDNHRDRKRASAIESSRRLDDVKARRR